MKTSPGGTHPTDEVLDKLCQRYKAIVLQKDDVILRIACHEVESDIDALKKALEFACALTIEIELWSAPRFAQAVERSTAARQIVAPEDPQVIDSNNTTDSNKLDDESEAPVVNFLNQVLRTAILRRASDIHFEPGEHTMRIRLRIDGVLQEIPGTEPAMTASLCARIKIMGQLNVAERRLPQDGQLMVTLQNQRFSLRISSLPTLYGEKIVLRILKITQQDLDLPQLGFTARDLSHYVNALKSPQGLILVTGPTGSGKTVTLYAGLRHLNAIQRNICSVEDPVEIPVTGINQTQINTKIDLSFAIVLRALLRQDPDVIMVGEIRDQETAEIAIKAAQTGHLVLSTLHTNSTCETLNRLAQMGIEGYQIAASLKLVIAQRLVRKLCPHCRKPHATFVNHSEQHRHGPMPLWIATGCERCHMGYYGRTGIYEILTITPALQQALVNNANIAELNKIAHIQGHKTLMEAGMLLVQQGLTSLEELYRVAGEGIDA